MFISVEKKSGGYWENKKFKDYFQNNSLAIIYFSVIILFENRLSNVKNNRRNHEEMNKNSRKTEEPAFFKKYFDSYPF
jgi:hypothetical protein